MSKKIALTRGFSTIVDNKDYEYLNQWKWRYQTGHRTGYAVRMQYIGKNSSGYKYDTIYMHRLITNAPKGMQVDHIDSNGLNNKRKNLRIVTRSENQMHQRIMICPKTSKYKGVSWNKKRGMWVSEIQSYKNRISVGFFNDEKTAAKAYNKMAKKIHGEFAILNKITVK